MHKLFLVLLLFFAGFMGYAYTQTSKLGQTTVQAQEPVAKEKSKTKKAKKVQRQDEINYQVEFINATSVTLFAFKGDEAQKVICVPHEDRRRDEWVLKYRTPDTSWFNGFPRHKYEQTRKDEGHQPVIACLRAAF